MQETQAEQLSPSSKRKTEVFSVYPANMASCYMMGHRALDHRPLQRRRRTCDGVGSDGMVAVLGREDTLLGFRGQKSVFA